MNILIGIAILLTLMLSNDSTNTIPSLRESLIGFAWVIVAALIPPLYATIQLFSTQKHALRDRQLSAKEIQRQITVHAIVWFGCTISIATWLKWPMIVRQAWGLDKWLLLDELLLLAPLVLSLIGSWWVQSYYQTAFVAAAERSKTRLNFVSLRCRVYLATVLIPIFVILALKELWPLTNIISPILSAAFVVVAVALFLCFMPWLISILWENRSIHESEGRLEFLELLHHHKLAVKDIRIWDTGNQIVNALVAGILPRFRVLMLSDLLLNSFPRHELRAILRHEAGHVRLGHLPIRIGFLLLPAMALIAIELDTNQTLQLLFERISMQSNLLSFSVFAGLCFIVYVVLVTAWLSKNMEFEADLYAIGAFSKTNIPYVDREDHPAQSMADALLRFAQQNPDQYSRRSLTHPSLFDRIDLIKNYVRDPKAAMHFRRRFITVQVLLAMTIVLVAGSVVIA